MAGISPRFVFLVALVLAAACSPAAPVEAPPAKPAAPAEAEPAPKQAAPAPKQAGAAPKQAEPAPAKPQDATPAAEKPGQDWEAEWERVLAVARQEGTVAVIGPRDTETRDVLTETFTREYGISVEYFGGGGRDTVPKVTTERAAGQYLWDVHVGGTSTSLSTLIPEGMVDPLEPALILPDVKNPAMWRGGELEFVDEGRTTLVMTPFHPGRLVVNPQLVDAESFRSFRDLLDPAWKGQILSDDPRSPGAGAATFLFFYMHPELGPDFIGELVEQELTFIRDTRQALDLVARGSYPILLGPSDATAEQLMSQGVPILMVDARQFREVPDINPSNGALSLFNRAPHPNAAKVYINWLLSREGQTAFVQAQGSVSSRLDVPTDRALPWRVPIEGATIKTYTDEARQIQFSELVPLLIELLGEQ